MLQNVFQDPLLHAAAIAVAKNMAFSLIALACLALVICRGLFGRHPSSTSFLCSVGISLLIALGLAGFNQAAGLRARLDAPRCFPIDSQIVNSYFTAAALLTIAFLLFRTTLSLRPSTPPQIAGPSEAAFSKTPMRRLLTNLPRVAGLLCVGMLAIVGCATLANWALAKSFFDLDCIRAEVLAPDAIRMWAIIHDNSPEDFNRLTKHLAEYVTLPGTPQADIDRAVDLTLIRYQAEFAPYLGALPDDVAIEYLLRRSALADVLPPSYCASYFGHSTKPEMREDIEAYRPETYNFASTNVESLFLLKRTAAGKTRPAARVEKSDWRALMRRMVAMGSENANFDYIYDRTLDDPAYCHEHSLFLQALAALDTPTAPDIRQAIAGSMLTGAQWHWVDPH